MRAGTENRPGRWGVGATCRGELVNVPGKESPHSPERLVPITWLAIGPDRRRAKGPCSSADGDGGLNKSHWWLSSIVLLNLSVCLVCWVGRGELRKLVPARSARRRSCQTRAAERLRRDRAAPAPRTLVNASEDDIAVASLDRSAVIPAPRCATYMKLLMAFEPPSLSFLPDRGRWFTSCAQARSMPSALRSGYGDTTAMDSAILPVSMGRV